MEDLDIITRVMEQHRVLLEQMSSVSATLSDRDALIRLEQAQAELAIDFRRPLVDRRDSLLESLARVEKGLEKHYAFEEELLPPLLGQLLTKALIIEHENLSGEAQKVLAGIAKINLKGLNRADEISQEAIMSDSLNTLRDKKLDHQRREEAILLTLQKISEEKSKRSI